MREKIKKIFQQHLFAKQLIKFTINGGGFTLIDFAFYFALTRLIVFFARYYLWANLISMVLAATGNFVVNKRWTFRNQSQKVVRQYIQFWVVALAAMLVYQYLLFWLVEKAEWYDLTAKVVAVLITGFCRFCLQKFWVFRK